LVGSGEPSKTNPGSINPLPYPSRSGSQGFCPVGGRTALNWLHEEALISPNRFGWPGFFFWQKFPKNS
jgi:hypothetical protein